jgi:hypothetical protein
MSMVSALIAGLLFGVGLMEVMDGQNHPHWLALLRLGPLQPLRA